MTDQTNPKEFLAKEWMKKATEDELSAKSLLTHRDAPPGGVCFFSQQIAEKSLKAFLVFFQKRIPKIHLLERLLEICVEIDQSFVGLKGEAALLDTFYVPTRYPGDYPEFDWQQAEKAFAAAIRIKEFVLNKLDGGN